MGLYSVGQQGQVIPRRHHGGQNHRRGWRQPEASCQAVAVEGEDFGAVEGAFDLGREGQVRIRVGLGLGSGIGQWILFELKKERKRKSNLTAVAGAAALAWFVAASNLTTRDNPSEEKTAELRLGRSGAMRMLRTYTVVAAEV